MSFRPLHCTVTGQYTSSPTALFSSNRWPHPLLTAHSVATQRTLFKMTYFWQ